MGPDGSTDYRARRPAVAFHPRAGEYLVTWIGNDLDPASAGEEEAFAQHVSATGAQRGTDDAPLSAEPEGDLYGSTDVEADPRGREYAATWSDCCSEGETDGLTARRVVAP